MTGPSIPASLMRRIEDPDPCGGARVLDLAICLILAVAIVGLLMLAL
ncbi:hypothetical protein [Methylobacterium oxalidis]|uniref:Uncharacterized protein n=1 Tax=Methylobacterium oxalidis TaxID=944322 RepID=A0A512IYI7_9HYPH|nr:hypothetical protein [Methylobacterium oxalidis]GEP02771.1 hypothetical protein MOX02_08090 [Methylobacterium oxalidis]GLS66829.1 hypothetical protein GCM10007888_52120 [Methylobacterium oxalidis]